MIEKIFVPHRGAGEIFLQKLSELLSVELLRFGSRAIRQRRFKFRKVVPGQFAVDPRRPFFFKRFHRGPSGGFAVSSGHKKVATLPCRWNTRAPRRSRGIACPRFPSSKSPRDVPAKAARSRHRSAPEFPGVPSACAEPHPPSALSARPDRFPSTEPRRRTRSRFLSPVFSATNRW